MTSLPATAQSGRAAPRLSFLVGAMIALLLAALVGAAVGAAISANRAATVITPAAGAVAPADLHPAPPIPPGALAAKAAKAAPMVRYRGLVADLAAAEARHDVRGIALYRHQLDAVLTPALIGTVYREHQRVMVEIALAERDSHAALLVRQLQSICGPASVKAVLEFCK